MDLMQFVRRPFMVEAIEITEENLDEIAGYIGVVRKRGDSRYIAVDRRIVPIITKAYVGWWLTVVGDNYRCYSPRMFRALFIPHSSVMAFAFDNGELEPQDRQRMLQEALRRVIRGELAETDVHVDTDPLPPHGIVRPEVDHANA